LPFVSVFLINFNLINKNYLLDTVNKTLHNDITQSKRRLELSKPATSFLFLGELKPLESTVIENTKRTKVRDAIRRYGDRKFNTTQVGNNVIVTRIQ
jgi:hypothetical protein